MVIPIAINDSSVYAIDSIPGDYSIRWRFEESHLDDTGHLMSSYIYSEGGSLQYDTQNPKEGSFSAFFDGKTMIYTQDYYADGKYLLTRLGGNSQISVSTLVKVTEARDQGIWEFLPDFQGDLYIRYTSDNKVTMGFNYVEIESAQIVPLNEWHLITYVWDGTEMKLYINGSLSASEIHPDAGTIDFSEGHWFADWYIGSGFGINGSPNFFDGYMDDFIVYGRALAAVEIQDMYDFYFLPQIPQYTVSFNVDGGTTVPSQDIPEDGKAVRPAPNPTKVGHTFDNWYTNSSFTTEFDFENTPITQDTTVFGKWDIIQYTVEFDSQGGSAVDNEVVDYNTILPTPIAPTRAGYSFSGWYREAGLINQWDFATDVVTTHTTLYARWSINQYSVSFDVDGGTAVASQTIEHNGKVVEPVPPTKTGHTFDGWYTNGSFGTEFDFDNTEITGNTVIYAKWNINQYTVTFDSQGGSSVGSETVDYDSLLSTPVAPTRAGYSFSGWYREAGLINQWDFATDAVTTHTTLYARWSINQYSVSFDVDGGTAVASQTIEHNGKVVEPAPPTKTGYTFDGWYTDSSFTTSFDFENTPITQDTDVYGKWDIIQYTVEFDSQGGSPVASQTVDYNSLLSTPTAPTRTGFNFGGWYKDPGLINQWNFGVDIVTENRTLYAKWLTPQDSITMIASPNNVEFTEDFNQIFTLNISNDTVIGSVYKSDINLGGVFSNLNIGQVINSETIVTAEVYGNLSSAGVG
ncbi:InlB B-repeat-containing protein, partial [Clostridium aceticum]